MRQGWRWVGVGQHPAEEEKEVQAQHQAPQPGGPAPRRRTTRISGFEGQQGLCMGEPEGCRK